MAQIKVDLAKLQELLPNHSNEDLAAQFGVTAERIRQIRRAAEGPQRVTRTTQYTNVSNTLEFRSALGTAPDAETAQRFGVPVNVVHHARVKAKIPSYAETRRKEIVPLLGKVPDRELAEKFGYSVNGVIALRERLKVAAPANNGTVGRRRAIRAAREVTEVKAAPVAIPVVVKSDVELAPPADQDATLAFLRTRHQVGDSTEALAARLEIPESQVKAMLGLPN